MRVPLLLHPLCNQYQPFLNEMTCRVSARPWVIYRSMNFVSPNLTFKTNVLGAQWLNGRVLDSRRGAAGSSLTDVTVLWSLSKTHLS